MTAWSRILFALNLAGAMVSAALLLSTWLAKGIIVSRAQDHALEVTRKHLDPAISKAADLLDDPRLGRLVPREVRDKLGNEITAYREAPDKWLRDKMRTTPSEAESWKFPEIKNPLARKSFDFVTEKLGGAKNHFERSFENLILDLRIFSGTNLAAFLLGAWLSRRPADPEMRRKLLAWSVFLALGTGFSILLFADRGLVWDLLWNHHFGWGYSACVAFSTLWFACYLRLAFAGQTPK